MLDFTLKIMKIVCEMLKIFAYGAKNHRNFLPKSRKIFRKFRKEEKTIGIKNHRNYFLPPQIPENHRNNSYSSYGFHRKENTLSRTYNDRRIHVPSAGFLTNSRWTNVFGVMLVLRRSIICI